MKKILSIIVLVALSMPLIAGIHSYTNQSVLSSGHWVKIRVSESGVCRMTFDQLREAGINPSQVRVFGYGGAMLAQDFRKTKIDDLPQVPVYVGADYILFWVQGPIKWSYNSDLSRFTHTRNPYSNYGYYFLSDNVGSPMTLPMADAVSGTPTDVTTYPLLQVHEKDSVNLIDRNGVSGGGREFYGEQFSSNMTRTFSFSTPNAVAGQTANAYIDVAGYSKESSYFRSTFNSTTGGVNIPAYDTHYDYGIARSIKTNASAVASRQQIKLKFENSTSGALGWLNYIELTTPSTLRMTGSYMTVRTTQNRNAATPVRFHLTNANSSTQIWDITRLDSIRMMPTTFENDELQWIGTQQDGIHEYVAVSPQGSGWVSASIVGEVAHQNLHQLSNIDYVIICPPGYESYAKRLARAHQDKEGITWAVVTDKQVYNEFSSGTPDATAYRWLMKMLYDRADGGAIAKPRWLLLMGHGTFDNRKILSASGTALLLTYQAKNSVNEVQAYATDDYFAFLDDNEGESDASAKMDIGVGRLPVNNTTEADEVVSKLIRYMRNQNPGKWKSQLVFLADDGESGTHTRTSEVSAEMVRLANPDFVMNKIFLDAYPQEVNASGESYPIAQNKLHNMLKEGVFLFDYSGHGSYHSITNESILDLKDIDNMRNTNHAFWLFVTCNFGQFDSGKRCASEAALMNPIGGAIGVCSATRTAYATQNTNLNRAVCKELFAHTSPFHYEATLGEAIARGKNTLNGDANKLTYVLLGDPALRLNYPTQYQVETLTALDTLNALSVQHVQGQIIDEDSLLVSDFNGTVDITVYDKIQTIPTRDNDDVGGTPEVVSYKDYTNILFTGMTEVKEGKFQYTFMVPKDIRYNYGNGRIVYHAQTVDEGETAEAIGHYEQFIIGGTGNIALADKEGPQMRIYLNSPSFQDGDKTYATPRFFAELYDENGINTAGAGIGHDLMLVIDDDAKQTYSINEYFASVNDSYQRGLVNYLMAELPDGPHSLTFRAWDLLNNSTTQSLNFIVEAGLDPSIYSITTYPNPVRSYGTLNMIVNYDQPDELIQTEVYLYNTNGQMVWKQTQENPDHVEINVGQAGLKPGIYFYNVRIKSANGKKYNTSSGKIIVIQ